MNLLDYKCFLELDAKIKLTENKSICIWGGQVRKFENEQKTHD